MTTEGDVQRRHGSRNMDSRHTYPVPDTPEARDHAAEAEEMRAALHDDLGVDPEMVAPTRDFRGHVRMNFDQADDILNKFYTLQDRIKELETQVTDLSRGSETQA